MPSPFLQWSPEAPPESQFERSLADWRALSHSQPQEFRELARVHLERLKTQLGDWLQVPPQNLHCYSRTRDAIEAVAHHLQLGPGGEVLASDEEYPVLREMWLSLSQKRGFVYRELSLPFPISDPDSILRQFQAASSHSTRLIYFSHITCLRAQLLPVQALCHWARSRGILSLVDGAHAAGQVRLNLLSLAPDYYCGCLHKWAGAPYGASFLYTPAPWSASIPQDPVPLVVSQQLFRALRLEPNPRPALVSYAQNLLGNRSIPITRACSLSMFAVQVPSHYQPAYELKLRLGQMGYLVEVFVHQGKLWMRVCLSDRASLEDFQRLHRALVALRPLPWPGAKLRRAIADTIRRLPGKR